MWEACCGIRRAGTRPLYQFLLRAAPFYPGFSARMRWIIIAHCAACVWKLSRFLFASLRSIRWVTHRTAQAFTSSRQAGRKRECKGVPRKAVVGRVKAMGARSQGARTVFPLREPASSPLICKPLRVAVTSFASGRRVLTLSFLLSFRFHLY